MTDARLTGANALTEVPLKRRLRRAERTRQVKALALVLPLLVFLLFTFAGPIAGMLWRAVDDREVRQVLPQTIAALADWDGKDLPDEKAYAALAGDIMAARASGTIAIAAKRLNYAQNGFRTILTSTACSNTPSTVTRFRLSRESTAAPPYSCWLVAAHGLRRRQQHLVVNADLLQQP